MGLFREFCGDTSLHGWQYIGRYIISNPLKNAIKDGGSTQKWTGYYLYKASPSRAPCGANNTPKTDIAP